MFTHDPEQPPYIIVSREVYEDGYYQPKCLVGTNWEYAPNEFPDATGYWPSGLGCPGGAEGLGEWDY